MLPNLFINGFACLTGDAAVQDFEPFLQARTLRRAEPVSKNALLCACRALAQAKLDAPACQALGISLAMGAGAVASTLKFMDSIIEDGDELSSPTAFASSVHNATALMLSMLLHINGPCVVTGQLDASFAGALLTAQQFLAKRMCPQVLVVVAEDVNPVLTSVLEKNPAQFDPFVYQPACAAQRVAGAFVVSATPTPQTQFVLEEIQLERTNDVQTHTPPHAPVNSCAHAVLLLDNLLRAKQPFERCDRFAGSILKIKGRPYVLS